MIILGALTDRTIEGLRTFVENERSKSDVNAFLSGRTDTFIGWDYAGYTGY